MGLSISCQVYVSHVHSGVVMRVVMTIMSVPVHQIDSPNPSPVLDHLLFTLPLRKKKSNRDQANICTPENGSGMLKEKKKLIENYYVRLLSQVGQRLHSPRSKSGNVPQGFPTDRRSGNVMSKMNRP